MAACRAGVAPGDEAWLLNEAALSLRALNRLIEARESMRAGMELYEQHEQWQFAAIAATNLSELELTLGDVPAAEATAVQSITFADRSGKAFLRIVTRTTQPHALHQAGRLEASRARFAEAETMRTEDQPPLLYSVAGYQYCDLLLAAAERAAWRRRAGFPPAGSPAVSPGAGGTNAIRNHRRDGRAAVRARRHRAPRRADASDWTALR